MDIYLTKGKVAVIDTDDWDKVKGGRWHLHKSKHHGKTLYYARGWRGGRKVYLHRFLMDAQPHEEVDHIDGDGLNCRRNNLECVPPRENKTRQAQRIKAASTAPAQHPPAR